MYIPSQQDLSKLPHTLQVYFALICAKQVAHLVKPEHKVACDKALETAELWLDGKATAEECKTAANAAYAAYAAAYAAAANAAADAAAYAAYAAAYAAAATADAAYAANAAANAAAYAAYAAYAYTADTDKQAIIEAQWVYYKELLAFETIVEDVLLA